MRALLTVTFCANLLLILASLLWLPERVAIHFGRGGFADGWASREVYALLLTAIEMPLFALLLMLPRLLRRIPKQWISLPNREHWLDPARAPATYDRLARHTDELGAATFGFLFIVGLLSFEANRLDPPRLDEGLFLIALIAFLAYTAAWVLRLLLTFRVPSDPQGRR